MKNRRSKKSVKLRKSQKRLGIALILIIMIGASALIANELLNEKLIQEEQTISSFSNTPSITYKVYTNPNIISNSTNLPEDQGYFANFTDYIAVNFQNQYNGMEGASIKGDYTINAEILGLETGIEEPVTAWSKQFNLVSKKSFESTEKSNDLSQTAYIDFHHYKTFAEQVDEQTEYETAHYIKVSMDINYTVSTKGGEITEQLNPTLTIPLGQKYYKIAKINIDEKKSEIKKTIEVNAPPNFIKLSAFSAIFLLCIIVLVPLLKSTEPSERYYYEKKIRKILKENGKRLVAVYDNIVNESLSICNVHSMNDMIKISDELERPILYVYQNDLADIKEFFVIEREKAYLYRVPEYQPADKKKKDPEKPEVSAESGDGGATATA